MPQAANYKKQPRPFKNENRHARFRYDFSKDGGAIGSYDLGILTDKVVILSSRVVVKTPVTSAGAATVQIGTTAVPAAFLASGNGTPANLVADAVRTENAGANFVAPANQLITMVIGTAALTGGVIEVLVTYADAP